jgi:hypothetical protein
MNPTLSQPNLSRSLLIAVPRVTHTRRKKEGIFEQACSAWLCWLPESKIRGNSATSGGKNLTFGNKSISGAP